MGKLELHTGEVHIWKLRWRELETFWEWHKPLLEKEEYQKVKHYHFYEDQMRYLRALNPKQQRVYMNNIGNIKSIIKLTAPHDVMISHPEEVAKILLEN